MGNPGTIRPDWFDDVHRLVDAARQNRDSLPRPSIDGERADFRFTAITCAPDTRIAVESALRTLGRELGLSFRADPRRTEFGSARHVIYEAEMPSGLIVSVTANGRHIGGLDVVRDTPELAVA